MPLEIPPVFSAQEDGCTSQAQTKTKHSKWLAHIGIESFEECLLNGQNGGPKRMAKGIDMHGAAKGFRS